MRDLDALGIENALYLAIERSHDPDAREGGRGAAVSDHQTVVSSPDPSPLANQSLRNNLP